MNSNSSITPIQFTKALCLTGCLLVTGALSANQNDVIERFESATTNWATPSINTQLVSTDNAEVPAAALGERVSLTVNSSEPSALLIAIVNTYGDVRLIKSDDLTGTAAHQFEAEAPVGQYSVFTFATNPAIPNRTLGIPEGTSNHQLSIGLESVDELLAKISSVASTHQIAKAPEFMFLVDDASLAMRGIRKKIKKIKDKKKTPLASVTAAVKSAASAVTETADAKPVTAEPETPVTPVIAEKSVEAPAAVDEPVKVVAAETEKVKEAEIVTEEVQLVEVQLEETTEPAMVVAALDTNNKTPIIATEVTQPEVQLTEVEATATTVTAIETNATAPDSLSLDIKFALNSEALTQSGINALDTLGSALLGFQRSGELPTIMLEGHTDDTGSEAYNLALSEKRAESARQYLLERFSLPADSVMSAGFGETSPKVLEQTREGRQANRRVELRIIN